MRQIVLINITESVTIYDNVAGQTKANSRILVLYVQIRLAPTINTSSQAKTKTVYTFKTPVISTSVITGNKIKILENLFQ